MNRYLKIPLKNNVLLHRISILESNYTYVLEWEQKALVVDPGDAQALLHFIQEKNLNLINILCTHHHEDHIGGVNLLKKNTSCSVIGPKDPRIKELDKSVDEGEQLTIGPLKIDVLSTPGHTKPHICFFLGMQHLLFSGDLLFSVGCGRVFEGTKEEMYRSLVKASKLPLQTLILPGHEYSMGNLEFASKLEPKNENIIQYRNKIIKNLRDNQPIYPTTLAAEGKINPFLRVSDKDFQKVCGFNGAEPCDVFAYLRELKDHS